MKPLYIRLPDEMHAGLTKLAKGHKISLQSLCEYIFKHVIEERIAIIAPENNFVKRLTELESRVAELEYQQYNRKP
jgi:hypothetical protein